MSKITLDTCGKDCPIPLIELKKAVAQSEKDQLIEVKFTCPDAVQNLPRFAQENNHEVIEFEQLGTEGWRIVIKK